MATTFRLYAADDLESLRALLLHPGLVAQFETFSGPHGLEDKLGDHHLETASLHLAFVDGAPAGFGFTFLLGSGERPWAMMKFGVLPAYRRRGLGRALLERVRAVALSRGPMDVLSSVWLPEPDTEAFFARMGFEYECSFWMMTRERGTAVARPDVPAGITLRTYDGSEAMLAQWTDAYNGSFIDHWRHVPATMEDGRGIAASPSFDASGLVLAFRGDEPVGFCRCTRYDARGEIGVLGTTRAARGIGLGRALLRWGVNWLEAGSDQPVTLIVQGENERALALYRSEGFAITRTRHIVALPASAR